LEARFFVPAWNDWARRERSAGDRRAEEGEADAEADEEEEEEENEEEEDEQPRKRARRANSRYA
jgi:hypothetical protein